MLAGKENKMDEEVEKQKREAQRNKMREDIAKRKEQLRLQVRELQRRRLFFQIFTRGRSEKPWH
jgi:hypothetical protein